MKVRRTVFYGLYFFASLNASVKSRSVNTLVRVKSKTFIKLS